MLSDDNGGWLTPEVAQAQADLVERELAPLYAIADNPLDISKWHPRLGEPYEPFMAALDAIKAPAGSTLLDVGCGVGHYGTLLRHLRPAIQYTGTDYSEHMVDKARQREPRLIFRVSAVRDNELDAYDIVLLSQCLEITGAPETNLRYVLGQADGYVILHRLRLGLTTGRITEPTYAGYVGNNWLWRRADLAALITAAGRRYQAIEWTRPDMLTMVLWPAN